MICLTASAAAAMALFRACLVKGAPALFPTDTIYGVGAPLTSVKANAAVFAVKKRSPDRPLPVLISDEEQLFSITENVTEEMVMWLRTVWPGRVTVVLKASGKLDPLYAPNGTVALRMPDVEWLRKAISEVGPITATSVNVTGERPTNDPAIIAKTFALSCPFMLWGKPAAEKPSAVVDITGGSPVIIRS